MNKGMMRLSILTVAFMAMMPLLVVGFVPAQEQNPPVSTTQKIPFNRTLPTPCKEKRIRLNGEFRAQYKVTRDADGQISIDGNFHANWITGSGLTSRGKYEAIGTARLESTGPSPTSFTYVFNFSLNKVRTNESLMGHVKFRINVDALGSATTSVIAANIDCTK